MSPRRQRIRKVVNPPAIKGFKPFGSGNQEKKSTPVTLLYEEYESLRLCDYEMFNHHQASRIMEVSRPTFTRIYASARQKVARAFVEGAQIAIEGGKVYFDSDWFQCKSCDCYFNNPEKDRMINHCPLCGSNDIHKYTVDEEWKGMTGRACDDMCVCPACSYEQTHQHGKPCNITLCPHCNIPMKRKRLT
jgi:predicted DNA-binding protein (UPF0251 family)